MTTKNNNSFEISISENFKKKATHSILAIIFFIAVYILLIGLAIGLTFYCGYFGLAIIALKPSFITLMIGLGIASLGILVLIFLVKFIFSKHKVDRSHLVEINESEQPQLFAFIRDIVNEVQTSFPKKIYLSSDVNAYVFYNSSFWSMFLPIKKNLNIGLGLVNSVTKNEFKAILAHEFGHFSQRSMKVGSFVYNVNQVIYNMLYENESFGNLISKWASISGFVTIFVSIAIKIIELIQWILRKVYNVVNINYMSLSREMEFHADEVAANVAGSQPLISSLRRLDLASLSLQTVLEFYNGKIQDAIISKNVFVQQKDVMEFLGQNNDLKFKNGLPQIGAEDLNKFNKSKLVIKDQWASHPSMEDRVEALENLNLPLRQEEEDMASNLFDNYEALQEKMTTHLFSFANYSSPVKVLPKSDFLNDFKKEYQSKSFNDIFNRYYDYRNPPILNQDEISNISNSPLKLEQFFSNEMVNLVLESSALSMDKTTLEDISQKRLVVKTFDYDGKKYKVKDANSLISKIQEELNQKETRIKENDMLIYQSFFSLAKQQGQEEKLKEAYHAFFEYEKTIESKSSIYFQMLNDTQFIQYNNSYEEIHHQFNMLASTEQKFKEEIKWLINQDSDKQHIASDDLNIFDQYLNNRSTYINNAGYNEKALNLLFESIHRYNKVLSEIYFKSKKDLLDFKVSLIQSAKIETS